MAKEKIYTCCICHRVLTDKKPIRLVRQKYGDRLERAYQQYYNIGTYDFCDRCYKPINNYIEKYK